jgi:gas vesicle protein
MSDNASEFGSFLAGFLIGGLVGAATALLLAPQSGEETRTVIKTKGIELKDKATTTTAEFRTRAEEYARSRGLMPPTEEPLIEPPAEIANPLES